MGLLGDRFIAGRRWLRSLALSGCGAIPMSPIVATFLVLTLVLPGALPVPQLFPLSDEERYVRESISVIGDALAQVDASRQVLLACAGDIPSCLQNPSPFVANLSTARDAILDLHGRSLVLAVPARYAPVSSLLPRGLERFAEGIELRIEALEEGDLEEKLLASNDRIEEGHEDLGTFLDFVEANPPTSILGTVVLFAGLLVVASGVGVVLLLVLRRRLTGGPPGRGAP